MGESLDKTRLAIWWSFVETGCWLIILVILPLNVWNFPKCKVLKLFLIIIHKGKKSKEQKQKAKH